MPAWFFAFNILDTILSNYFASDSPMKKAETEQL